MKNLNYIGILGLLFIVFFSSCVKQKRDVAVPSKYCPELVRLAEEGNPEAQYVLGKAYIDGEGVDSIPEKGMEWIQKSAEQNYSKAIRLIGEVYENGIYGYEQNYEKAFTWYSKGSSLNDDDSQVDLGVMYLKGIYVKQDYEEALKLFNKAAEKNNEWAFVNLACMYFDGLGVNQDYNIAREWAIKGAEKNNGNAENILGIMYENGLGVPKDGKRAFEYYSRGADHGSATAQYNLAMCYDSGIGTEKDTEQALKWLFESGNNYNDKALNLLGTLFIQGTILKYNEEKAIFCFEGAAQQGNSAALESLTLLANRGISKAQFALGSLYLKGSGVEPDTIKAKYWFEEAARFGNRDAIKAIKDLQRKKDNKVQLNNNLNL